MTTRDCIAAFLSAQRASHNGPDLLARWHVNLETQVNVAQGAGEPVAGKRNTYSDGVNNWWHIRIPKDADANPHWSDYPLNWPLAQHAEAIGSTGWNWAERASEWVGFDFDALTGHAQGIGLAPEQLERIRAAATELPYVEVRHSTGGQGLHLYVLLDRIATANHSEHAALARAVLAKMGSEAGCDFAQHVDCCGGNLWIWHRRANASNGGLALIKPAALKLAASDLHGWRDHLDVVTRKRAKVRLPNERAEALAESRKPIPLDDSHKRLIDRLAETGYSTAWVADHNLLQTHTCALAQVEHQGIFATISPGTNPAQPNCFAFPLPGGAWRVYRFSQGAKESDSWTHEPGGWTWTLYNCPPDLPSAAAHFGGALRGDGGGFWFDSLAQALPCAEALGAEVNAPEDWSKRPAILRADRKGNLLVELAAQKNDRGPLGWELKAKHWRRAFPLPARPKDKAAVACDNVLRVLKSAHGDHLGLFTRNAAGTWDSQPFSLARAALSRLASKDCPVDHLLADALDNRWTLVSLPFQPEYPGGRQWNRDAPQLRVTPQAGVHPHWDLILDHIGQTITEPLQALEWAQQCSIKTGADYLRAWVACVLRDVFAPTPYLFLFGPEKSGKSILWEALALLVSGGIVKADRALTNQNDFNGELASAIICVVEEKDVANTPGARNKLKDYVTSPLLSIRRMRTDAYMVPNMTHWLQMSNDRKGCFVFPGDTRITAIHVPPFAREIPKPILMDKLGREAPAFLHTLFDLDLPPAVDRLRLPVVETPEKAALANENQDDVTLFVRERLPSAASGQVAFSLVYDAFTTWLDPNERHKWTRRKFADALHGHCQTKRGTQGATFILDRELKP